MPRQPRLAFENSFYHVFNRGINKQKIFLKEADYHFFLHKLKDLKKKYDHSLYAFCLMPNHFHLSIRTRKVPISKIMASLTTSYSMYFNRTYNHFGPVYQNRYKSILIENDSYFLKLSQYIYLNPVKARIVKDPIDYPYSSIREALGKKPLSFLDEDIVRLTGNTDQEKIAYNTFIYDGIDKDMTELSELFEKEEVIFGSDKFATRALRKLAKRRAKNTLSLA